MRPSVKRSRVSGFTLAELLIVVMIIGVMVGLSLPTLTDQLEKARQSTDIANLRGAYASARIAEINGEIVTNGKKFRIADQSDDMPGAGDYAGCATVFWYEPDFGLFPDKYSFQNPDKSFKPDAIPDDLRDAIADKSLITCRMMAHKTRVVIDDNLPACITYGTPGADGHGSALPGQFSAGYSNLRIRVTFGLTAETNAYTLTDVRFADIMEQPNAAGD